MRPRQTVLFIVLLLATIGSLFTVFLPDSDTQGPSPGVAARLQPIVDEDRARVRDAAAGRFASNADMAALKHRLERAEDFTPTFSSEQSKAADARATSAAAAYTAFAVELVAAKTRPVDERDRAINARLTNRVAQAMQMGAGSGITKLKALFVQIALFVLLPATFIVAFGPALVRGIRAAGLRRNGTLMHGVVVSTAPTGMMTNYVPEYRATIRLDDGGTSTATLLAYTGLPVGSDVMVKVNPRDTRTAVIVSGA
jgi:hypothetical protein